MEKGQGAKEQGHARCDVGTGRQWNITFDTGAGEYFNLPGHDLADFNFQPFEKIRSRDPFVLEAKESFWIQKYGVLNEGGMNRRS